MMKSRRGFSSVSVSTERRRCDIENSECICIYVVYILYRLIWIDNDYQRTNTGRVYEGRERIQSMRVNDSVRDVWILCRGIIID